MKVIHFVLENIVEHIVTKQLNSNNRSSSRSSNVKTTLGTTLDISSGEAQCDVTCFDVYESLSPSFPFSIATIFIFSLLLSHFPLLLFLISCRNYVPRVNNHDHNILIINLCTYLSKQILFQHYTKFMSKKNIKNEE